MGDEPFTTRQTTSTGTSKASRSPHQMAYAAERAKVLFGSYRRGDANDPDRYVAAIAKVLSSYETSLIHEVTDPETGISATEKFMSFMPNAGELKVYCDAIAARRDRIQRLGAIPQPDFTRPRLPRPPARPGDLATVFIPTENIRYPQFVEWAKTADPKFWKFGVSSDNRQGIWISYDVWDLRQIATRPRTEAAIPRLDLSEEAKRAMASRDAERCGNTPADQQRAAEGRHERREA